MRAIVAADFAKALQTIKSSVSVDQLKHYDQWTKEFGTAT